MTSQKQGLHGLMAALATMLLALTAHAGEPLLAKLVEVNIPAQSLSSAVIELSRQSGTQIQMSSELVKNQTTQGVSGKMTLDEALRKLLEGTALGFHPAGDNTIGIDATRSTLDVPGQNQDAAESAKVENVPVAPLAPPANDWSGADDSEIPEVVVTANKRRQNLRDIPGSVAVVSGEKLEAIKAQGLADYIKLVPGVVLVDRGADSSLPIIRGIAASTGGLATQFSQLPVGIYVDDMPFNDLYVPFTQPDLNPFDLERVEILKGPQGTLFGSGALAGAIRYILKKPTLEIWETKLSATFLSNNQGEGLSPVYGAAQNIPLFGDKAAVRVVGLLRENTGTIDELGRSKDVDRLRQQTARVLGKWEVNERFKLNGFYFLQESEYRNAPGSDNPERFERSGQITNFRTSGISGANLSASYGFDWADLLSSSNYILKDTVNDVRGPLGIATPGIPIGPPVGTIGGDPDGDGGENGPGTEDAGQDAAIQALNSATDSLFQEFRLTSPEGGDWKPWDWLGVQWLVGGAYQRSAQGFFQRTDVAPVFDALSPADSLPIIPVQTPLGPVFGSRNVSLIYAELNSVATETSFFGEATARLGEHWELTAGARVFDIKLHVKGFLSGATPFALDAGRTQTNVDEKFGERGINPRFSLRYLLNQNVQVVALASKGFQFGGIQLNPPVAVVTTTRPSSLVPFLSSKLWNYEVGLRTDFFDHRLKWDTTLFYLDWKDLQITVPRPLFPVVPGFESANVRVNFIENIGSARSQGVETALSLSPLRGLSFTSNAAWISAVTTEGFDSLDGFVPTGTRLPASPRFQIANVVSYSAPLSFLGQWQSAVSLTHTHIGTSFNNLYYTRQQGGYDTLDASFNLLTSGWSLVPDLTVSMLNVMDVRGVAAVNTTAGVRDVGYFLIQPRTLLLSLGARF